MTTGLLFGGAGGALEVRAGVNGAARIAGRFPYGARAVLSDGAGRGRRREEQFAPRAFEKRILDKRADIYLLFAHQAERPLASRAAGSLAVEDGDDALRFEAVIPSEVAATTHGADALALIRSSLATGLSPGFRVLPDGEQVTENDGVLLRTISSADLIEISIVTFPAYPAAHVESRNWRPDARTKNPQQKFLQRWRP